MCVLSHKIITLKKLVVLTCPFKLTYFALEVLLVFPMR